MAAPFIAGKKPVLEYIRNQPTRIDKVFLLSGRGLFDIISTCQAEHIPYQFMTKIQLIRRFGEPGKKGVLAVLAGTEILAPELLLDQYLSHSVLHALLFDRLTDVRNAGAIIRSGIAFGFNHFVFESHRNVGIPAIMAASSAGYAAMASMYRIGSPTAFIQKLKKHGIAIICLDAKGQDIRGKRISGPYLLVVGGENKGIRKTILQAADYVLAITMKDTVESLNASVSAAIAMYELNQGRCQ